MSGKPGRILAATLAAAAAGCVARADRPAYRSGVLGDADRSIRYDLPDHVATEARGDGAHKLNFSGHEMLFENGRIELDGTDVWARHYHDVVVTRARTGALLLTVDGRRVPTQVLAD